MSFIDTHNDDVKYDIVTRLENLYSKHSIYRTIIVCPDNFLDIYKYQLEKHDHNVYVLDEYEAIDYDTLDTRIFIINEKDFIKFIERHNDNDGNYFYNMILFSSKENKETLTSEYKSIIKSGDNIII
jgi:hypothetical protein